LVQWIKSLIQLRKGNEVWSVDHPLRVNERIRFSDQNDHELRYELKDFQSEKRYTIVVNTKMSTLADLPSARLELSWPANREPGDGLGMWIYQHT